MVKRDREYERYSAAMEAQYGPNWYSVLLNKQRAEYDLCRHGKNGWKDWVRVLTCSVFLVGWSALSLVVGVRVIEGLWVMIVFGGVIVWGIWESA